MSIEAKNITKSFGQFRALDNVNLKVESGELVALLGPSGSGKTTLLRIIGGLDHADPGCGSILFQDEDVSGTEMGKRRVGFVFQHYALFKHMTVFENAAFGLRSRPWRLRPSKQEIKHKVMELLTLVQLQGLVDRYPSQLSGGQRQRVALARALAVGPKVLLLDEPFGALDATVRRELRRWLRRLHDEIHVTSIFVTHDQEEALEVADRVAVMNAGRIEQIGTPEEVYEKPANPFVYRFMGNVNLFHARQDEGPLRVGNIELAGAANGSPNGQPVAFVRPHDVEISCEQSGESIPAEVRHVGFAGASVNIELKRLDVEQTIDASVPSDRYRELKLSAGQRVFVSLRKHRLFGEDYAI